MRARPHSTQDLEPSHLRQLQVQQDDLWQVGDATPRVLASRCQVLQGLLPVARDDDFVGDIVLLECPQRKGDIVWIVLDQQDALATHGCSPFAEYDTCLSLIHISEPTRLGMISYAVFCL